MARRVAVYDLGSSSFHLLVCDVEDDGGLCPVRRHRAVLELGTAVGAAGSVPPDRLRQAVRTVQRLAEALEPLEPDIVAAFGTAALRDAGNRDELVERLGDAIGVPISVLDGAEEARRCFIGQRAAVWCDDRPTAGVDLGGGSLELAVGTERAVSVATSVGVGATRFRGELGDADPVGQVGRHAIGRRVAHAVAGWAEAVRDAGASTERLIASGGTVRALARVATARARRPKAAAAASVHQVELCAGQVRALADELVTSTAAQRRALPGMPARRVASIGYGAAVLDAVVSELGVGHLVVSEWGLREGTVLELAGAARRSARTGADASPAALRPGR
jgi:exopolyphosphatase/guanosine-5'-triphosphate,3'-diphosphate pyrophosphatase